ncbi:MAG: hypothetical protein PUC41_03150 [Oscillospiraceae bacterium]|nr:hypothetical protein [Oscillospiraceae bacterium]
MMRKLCIFAVVLLMLLFSVGSIKVSAATTDNLQQDLADTVNADSLDLPDELEELLGEHHCDLNDPATLLTLSPGELCSALWDMAVDAAAAPLRLLGTLLMLTMLSAGLGSMGDACVGQRDLQRLLFLICSLVCVGIAAKPLCDCLHQTATALEDAKLFMLSFVPVFTASVTASGHIASGIGYQTFLFFLIEAIGVLQTNLLFPAMQSAAALSLADCINPAFSLHRIVEAIRKAVVWILGTVMTVFTALLSVRSFVAVSADGLSAKTLKLLSAGLIPVVGSAVSDAYATLQGSLRLMRNGIGVVGILAILWLMLPPLLTVLLYRAVFSIAALPAEIFGTGSLAALYRNSANVLSAAMAILIAFTMMMVLSTALMLLLLQGNQ